MRTTLLLATAALGCRSPGPDATATLAELPPLHLSVELSANRDTGPTTGTIGLGFDPEAFRDEHDGACAVVRGLAIRVPGAEITGIDEGGDDGERGCNQLSIFFELYEFGPTQRFTVSDASLTIDATFALEQRLPTLRNASEWRFGASQLIGIGWSHPADFSLAQRTTPVEFVGGGRFFEVDATLTGDEIVFTLPEPMPFTGAAELQIDFGVVSNVAMTCVGAVACEAALEAGYAHGVVLE